MKAFSTKSFFVLRLLGSFVLTVECLKISILVLLSFNNALFLPLCHLGSPSLNEAYLFVRKSFNGVYFKLRIEHILGSDKRNC